MQNHDLRSIPTYAAAGMLGVDTADIKDLAAQAGVEITIATTETTFTDEILLEAIPKLKPFVNKLLLARAKAKVRPPTELELKNAVDW